MDVPEAAELPEVCHCAVLLLIASNQAYVLSHKSQGLVSRGIASAASFSHIKSCPHNAA